MNEYLTYRFWKRYGKKLKAIERQQGKKAVTYNMQDNFLEYSKLEKKRPLLIFSIEEKMLDAYNILPSRYF